MLRRRSCTLKFDGSSLGGEAYERLAKFAESGGGEGVFFAAPVRVSSARWATKSNTTPLTWFVKPADPFERMDTQEGQARWAAQIEPFLEKYVEEGSSLARFFEFDKLIFHLSTHSELNDWDEAIADINALLCNCSAAEAFYYATEIFKTRRYVRKQDQSAVAELLKNALPLYAHLVGGDTQKSQRVIYRGNANH